MGLQSIIEKSEFTNFLQCGAILQLEPDQFKLIWGPFHALTIHIEELEDEITAIYKPQFWDFISNNPTADSTFVGTRQKILNRQQLLECLQMMTGSAPVINWEAPAEAQFQKQFQWSKYQFSSGDLAKTVPIIYQKGASAYTISHLVHSLTLLLEGQHFGATYGYWDQGQGFLGQTPESIIKWNPETKVASTMALAGTLPDQTEAENAIQLDPKISKEHEIVVDDLSNVVRNTKLPSDVQIQKRQTLKLKYLVHLLTPILIKNVEFKDTLHLVQAIHPSAALGLYPRSLEKFKQWNEFQIQKERMNFAAPFGFMSKNKVHVIAAIRNFYFNKAGVQIYSGCGVTSESDLNSELSELQTKRNSVKKMMGLGE